MTVNKSPHDYNPYQAPETIVYESNDEIGELLDTPVSLPAGSGLDWLKHAWSIFMARPLLWIGFTICYVVILSVLSLIPIVNFFAGFIGILVMAGVTYVAYQIDMDEPTGFGDFFMGFRHNVGQQLLLAVLYLIGVFITMMPMGLVMLFGLTSGMVDGSNPDVFSQTMGLNFALLLLVMMLLIVPLIMCIWLAPILILFHDVSAFTAMKLSFKACLKNILPFLVLGVLLIFAIIIAIIPLGLGLFALIPVMMITNYTAYKDILTAQ